MSTIRTDNIQSTDNSVNIPVAELARSSDVDDRVIYVGSVADLDSLESPEQDQEALVLGVPFKYTGAEWLPSAGYVTPEIYGAVGDGLADDSYALEAAFQSGFKVLGNPESTYRITR